MPEGYAERRRGQTRQARRRGTVGRVNTQSQAPAVEIRGLTKRFGGTTVVDDLAFRVEPGRVTGFFGPAGAVHPGRRARDHLAWLAASNALPAARVGQLLERTGLSSVAGKRVGGFSLGMRQRLGIAAALHGDPPILLFDEPVNGLDPEGVLWIRTLMKSMAAEG